MKNKMVKYKEVKEKRERRENEKKILQRTIFNHANLVYGSKATAETHDV